MPFQQDVNVDLNTPGPGRVQVKHSGELIKKKKYLIALLILMAAADVGVAQTSAPREPKRFAVGGLFSILPICDPHGLCDLKPRTEVGIGGRITYNFNRYIAAEGELNFFPRDYRKVISNFTGGRLTQGLFGGKFGFTKRRFGLFGKVRPGFESSGHAEIPHFLQGDGPDRNNPFGFEKIRATQFALDVGGVFEWYPSRRTILRFDVGDTIVRYPNILFTHFPDGATTVRSVYSHRPQFSAGFALRF
jgi:hypothetical protein